MSTKHDWRRLFTQYHPDHDCLGYVLIENSKIVGMLGMIFSQRRIAGQQFDFCNTHSWFVDEPYRGHSLRLMRPSLKLNGFVLTDFSATPDVVKISNRLGYHQIDGRLQVLLPSWRRTPMTTENFEIITNVNEIRCFATEAEQKLMEDHPSPAFGCLMVRDNNRNCLVLHSTVKRHWQDYCYVLYVSNISLFAESSFQIRFHLTRQTQTRYVAVDARRFATVKLPSSFKIPASTIQLVRGDGVDPSKVDALYSEVAFLRLTTMPSVSHALRNSWRLNKGDQR